MSEFSVHFWDDTGVPVHEITIEKLNAPTALNAAVQIFTLHVELGDYFIDPRPLVVQADSITVFRAESAGNRKAIITVKNHSDGQAP